MSGELTAPCGLHSADRIPLREGLFETAREFERLLEELDFEEYAALKAQRNGVFGDYGAFGRVLPAIGGLLEFGFRELDMHRIFPTCDTENHASAHVMVKLGMQRQAAFRQDVRQKARWRDTYLYAILEDEWRRSRAS